jgi:signal transduction histidine kinase
MSRRGEISYHKPTGLAGPAGRRADDNEGMLRVANYAVRALLLVLAGVLTFTAPWPGAARLAVQAVAFGVTAVLLIFVVPADRSAPASSRWAPVLPYAFGVMVVMCGVAAMTPTGGFFSILIATTMIGAGAEISLVAGFVVAGFGTAAIEVAGLVAGVGLATLIEYPLLLVFGLVLGRNLQAHRVSAAQSAALLAQAEQLREEQATVATLGERTRIAREIHDVLAHSLGALALNIQAARAVLTDQHDEARAVELLDQAQRMATDGLNETRRAVHALRGETLPLPEGLAELSAAHQRRHGARVTFEVTGAPRPLAPDAGLAITRAAQEALVNTAKHAPHQPIEIRLDYAEASTSLKVVNHLAENGHGGDEAGLATVNGRYGLTGLRERLLLLDGTLSAGRTESDWVVVAEVPR